MAFAGASRFMYREERSLSSSDGDVDEDTYHELGGPEGIAFKVHGTVPKHNMSEEAKKSMDAVQRLDFDPIENEIMHRGERLERYNSEYKKEGKKWLLSFFIGALTGLLAFSCAYGTSVLTKLKYDAVRQRLPGDLMGSIGYFFLFNTAFCAIGGFLVAFVQPIAAGSGIPEVKAYLNGARVRHLLNVKTLVCKLVGVTLGVSGSLIIGKEGPMVHTGACTAAGLTRGRSKTLGCDFNIFSEFRNDRDQRDFLSAGAAAGVAAAFGAPVGGILFALEEASSFWNPALTWRAFFCAMISTFTLNFFVSGTLEGASFGDFNTPGLIMFNVTDTGGYQLHLILPFIILGIVGGLLGAFFNKLNIAITIWRRSVIPESRRCYRMSEVLLVSLITSALCSLLPYVMECKDFADFQKSHPDWRNSTEEMLQPQVEGRYNCPEGYYNPLSLILFNSQEHSIKYLFGRKAGGLFPFDVLIVAFFGYFFLALITYGIAMPSGLFVPMMAIGSTYGRLLGIVWKNYVVTSSSVDVGTFALMGAASMLGGCVRMTVSLTVIILEITNDIQFLLPIMLVVMIAKWVGDHFNGPLYDAHVKLKNIPFLEPAGALPPWVGTNVLACDVMSKKVKVIAPIVTVSDAIELLRSNRHNCYPVVTENRVQPFFSNELGSQDSNSFDYKPQLQTGGINQMVLPISSSWTAEEEDDDQAIRGLHLKGIILRSQLLTLLSEHNFAPEDVVRERGINQLSRSRFNARHFKKHYNITAEDFNINETELDKVLDLRPYMHASPYLVEINMPVSRVFRLFRTMGLRHLCVVDQYKNVRGMITAKDLVEHTLEEKVKTLNQCYRQDPALFEKRMENIRGKAS